MSHFLSVLPLWELILLVVIIPTAVAVGLQIVVRKSVGFERLELNNEVAGSNSQSSVCFMPCCLRLW